MMLDEPYRFAEVMANRRDYIEDQLRGGSPVVGVTYSDGILLLTLGRGQLKVSETYDRIAMGSVGHPTDIEKLRQSAVDLASVVGFNYSEADVTLQQIVHFGLGPAIKGSFDDVIHSPYIARILLAELEGDHGSSLCTIDYDGSFSAEPDYATVGGSSDADRAMNKILKTDHDASASLGDSLNLALKVWAAGRSIGLQDEAAGDEVVSVQDDEIRNILKEAVEDLTVEAVVLSRSRDSKSKYHALTMDDIQPVVDAILA